MVRCSIHNLNVYGRRVLTRVDFNVPVDEHSHITDDTRIVASLPTLHLLREKGARSILLAHLGRPKGKPVERYSLKPVFNHLRKLIGNGVFFCPDCVGSTVKATVRALKNGDVLLLENVRFHAEEEANDAVFAADLAQLGEIYINDAFGVAHRAHASTVGVPQHLSTAVAGLLMEKELHYLYGQLKNPRRPFLVILGGSKISDKIGVIRTLMEKADTFLVGGAMAYTFLKAKGIPVGSSVVEEDKLDLARELLALSEKKGVGFFLPVDAIETFKILSDATWNNTPTFSQIQGITHGWMGVDIGIETRILYSAEIAQAATILWNGPLGIFETQEFSFGTRAIAEAIATNTLATSIVGGGDSVTAIKCLGFGNKMTFLSTGGGASLALLEEGLHLPAIAALHCQEGF